MSQYSFVILITYKNCVIYNNVRKTCQLIIHIIRKCHMSHTNGKCALRQTHTGELCHLDVLLQTTLYMVIRPFTGVLLWDVGAKFVN